MTRSRPQGGRKALPERVGDRVVQQMRTPPPAFSERERHILRQLAEKCPNREIARALFLREPTVKSLPRRIFNGLDVGTRAAGVSTATELRLLEWQLAQADNPEHPVGLRWSGTGGAARVLRERCRLSKPSSDGHSQIASCGTDAVRRFNRSGL